MSNCIEDNDNNILEYMSGDLYQSTLKFLYSVRKQYGEEVYTKMFNSIKEIVSDELTNLILMNKMKNSNSNIVIFTRVGSKKIDTIKCLRMYVDTPPYTTYVSTFTGTPYLGLKDAKDIFENVQKGQSVEIKIKQDGLHDFVCEMEKLENNIILL